MLIKIFTLKKCKWKNSKVSAITKNVTYTFQEGNKCIQITIDKNRHKEKNTKKSKF